MHPYLRTSVAAVLFLGTTAAGLAAARKPECTVRFHVEVESATADPFSMPVKLLNPPRQIFVEGSAAISERQIKAVHVYPAADGSWGALFRLDSSGALVLGNLSGSNRGRCFVVYVGKAKVARQIAQDILIDRRVVDGLIPIPKGLTYSEAMDLQKRFPPLTPATPAAAPERPL